MTDEPTIVVSEEFSEIIGTAEERKARPIPRRLDDCFRESNTIYDLLDLWRAILEREMEAGTIPRSYDTLFVYLERHLLALQEEEATLADLCDNEILPLLKRVKKHLQSAQDVAIYAADNCTEAQPVVQKLQSLEKAIDQLRGYFIQQL